MREVKAQRRRLRVWNWKDRKKYTTASINAVATQIELHSTKLASCSKSRADPGGRRGVEQLRLPTQRTLRRSVSGFQWVQPSSDAIVHFAWQQTFQGGRATVCVSAANRNAVAPPAHRRSRVRIWAGCSGRPVVAGQFFRVPVAWARGL